RSLVRGFRRRFTPLGVARREMGSPLRGGGSGRSGRAVARKGAGNVTRLPECHRLTSPKARARLAQREGEKSRYTSRCSPLAGLSRRACPPTGGAATRAPRLHPPQDAKRR